MKFTELDRRMRIYETSHDQFVVPGVYVVARIDGRNFTRLARELQHFEAPYDTRFRDLMVETTLHLMTVGFQVLYANTHSDEINLLISPRDDTFGRKTRKWLSVLAGEASARFSVGLGSAAAFDARLCELPNPSAVVDYYRWRQEDADRNALNAHCYWRLRAEGQDAQGATQTLHGMSVAAKNQLLFERGINFNELPNWQKRGIGVVWAQVDSPGTHPLTGEMTASSRRHPEVLLDLPMREDYNAFVAQILAGSGTGPLSVRAE